MSDAQSILPATRVSTVQPTRAESDEALIALWLHGRSAHTQRAYGRDARRFLVAVGAPLRQVTLEDLHRFQDSLSGAPATRARAMAAVKSLLAHGHRLGYLPFDVGAAVQLQPVKDSLAERILTEREVMLLIEAETDPRNRLLLQVLYYSGARVSEVCALRWRDCKGRGGGAGQVTLYGKRNKTRAVMIPASIWKPLWAQKSDPEAPVFLSRKGGTLDPSQVFRIIREAARRAGVEGNVSPHWMRHSHATHAMDRGAPIHLVQATLGHANPATTGRYLHVRPSESSSRFLPE